MRKKLLAKYKNGNYFVELYEDGTKVKYTEDDYFNAEFPESMDLKITNRCDLNCPMCHEKSTPNGRHADINAPFLKTLKAGTELAIGGGNPLMHNKIHTFLEMMKTQGVVCNITINEQHFLKLQPVVEGLIKQKLIYGLGISLNECNEKTIAFAKQNKNVVFHIINGIFDNFDKITNQNLKVLILGYKKFGRGEKFYSKKVQNLIDKTKQLLPTLFDKFACLCFDNLALKQLDVKSLVSTEDWENFYMGDDGECTMYVDLVEQKFAKSSTSTERYDILDNIEDMFKKIKISKGEPYEN